MQSIRENDFECFAKTGVNAPRTMSPSTSDPINLVSCPGKLDRLQRSLGLVVAPERQAEMAQKWEAVSDKSPFAGVLPNSPKR